MFQPEPIIFLKIPVSVQQKTLQTLCCPQVCYQWNGQESCQTLVCREESLGHTAKWPSLLRRWPSSRWNRTGREFLPNPSRPGSPLILLRIFLSVNTTVQPSLSQKCSKSEFVTRFPVQEWAISWAITLALDLSTERRVRVAKVRQGFSIPPNENEGCSTKIS